MCKPSAFRRSNLPFSECEHPFVVDLAGNFGQHRALLTGIAHATGDLIFVMDSDREEEPEWITSFHAKLAQQRQLAKLNPFVARPRRYLSMDPGASENLRIRQELTL